MLTKEDKVEGDLLSYQRLPLWLKYPPHSGQSRTPKLCQRLSRLSIRKHTTIKRKFYMYLLLSRICLMKTVKAELVSKANCAPTIRRYIYTPLTAEGGLNPDNIT
jgi:hypothetical protein